jgi:hypothetical protein
MAITDIVGFGDQKGVNLKILIYGGKSKVNAISTDN